MLHKTLYNITKNVAVEDVVLQLLMFTQPLLLNITQRAQQIANVAGDVVNILHDSCCCTGL